MKHLILFLVFVLQRNVSSQDLWDVLGKNSNKIITHYKVFTLNDYKKYLDNLLRTDNIDIDKKLDFPMSLSSDNYTLTEGKVARFYEPVSHYGSFNSIVFHQLNKEFFGITQVYGPKIDFSFKFTSRFRGSRQSGSFSVVISHAPLELQIDFGDKDGDTCTLDKKGNDVFYFYDEKITHVTNFGPDTDKDAARYLAKHISATWLGELYRIIMKIKIEKISSDAKKKLLTDYEFQKKLAHICTKIQ